MMKGKIMMLSGLLLIKNSFQRGLLLLICIVSGVGYTYTQDCHIEVNAIPVEIYCGQETILTLQSSGSDSIILDEAFNSGSFGPGWGSTPGAVDWTNPCGSGADGTPYAWMGSNTTFPRAIESDNYDLSGATAGITLCFDMKYAEQGGGSPCEGPDLPSEGVHVQYSTDGGATWIDIAYYDPNGGHDPSLINWNNYCLTLPASALTSSTTFRWFQNTTSGALNDHWGIDNVYIAIDDQDSETTWGSPGDSYYYTYPTGSHGGDNPNTQSPTSTTTYYASIEAGNGDVCTDSITVIVKSPVFDFNGVIVDSTTALCLGDCAHVSGVITQIGGRSHPAGVYSGITGSKATISPVLTFPGDINGTSVNNVQNTTFNTVQSKYVRRVCIDSLVLDGVCSTTDFSDVKLFIECPGGSQVKLANIGDLSGQLITDLCFEVGFPPLASGSAPFSGTFAPVQNFNNLNGCSSTGDWKLILQGENMEACIPSGYITGWSITYTPIIDTITDISWSPGNFLTDPNSLDNQICPTGDIDYTITASNGVPACATDSMQLSFTVDTCNFCPTLQTLSLNGCTPNTVDLMNGIDSISDITAILKFYTSNSNAQNDVNEISSSVTTSGTYWVRIEDAQDPTCFNIFQIDVHFTTVSFTSEMTKTGCNDNIGELEFHAIGGDAPYHYTLIYQGDSTLQNDSIFDQLYAGSYDVVITDSSGCKTTGTVTVDALNSPEVTLDNKNNPSCYNEDDGSITVNVTGGTAPYSYSWNPGNLGNDTVANQLSSGNYIFTVTDNVGCMDSINVSLTNPDSIAIDYTTSDATCGKNDGNISLQVGGGTGNYSYSWKGSTSVTHEANNLATGDYKAIVTDQNGCSDSITISVGMSGSFYIEASSDNSTINLDENTGLHVNIDPNVEVDAIQWTPSDNLSCSDCQDPIATPEKSTLYIVTVTDTLGCISKDSVMIKVILPCYEVFVPNSFSPNNDGLNDLQCVLGNCIISFDFIIFNRWGEQVFQSVYQDKCWDGTYRGQPVQSGIYIYKLSATTKEGERIEKTGNITVIR